MIEKLIDPKNYTPEILTAIRNIQYRMDCTLLKYNNDDIKVIKNNNVVYILGNPLLGSEPIFDNDGNFLEMIPMFNITLQYDEDWLAQNHNMFTVKFPRLRILRPDLCERIIL